MFLAATGAMAAAPGVLMGFHLSQRSGGFWGRLVIVASAVPMVGAYGFAEKNHPKQHRPGDEEYRSDDKRRLTRFRPQRTGLRQEAVQLQSGCQKW